MKPRSRAVAKAASTSAVATALSRRRMARRQLAILGGHLVDPKLGIDGVADVFLSDGKVAEVRPAGSDPRAYRANGPEMVIDASGCYVLPGLIDMHVHLRTPGQEEKEDPKSGGQAAARGGFTTICCMPNTKPALDNPRLIEEMLARFRGECPVRVIPFAAMTKGNRGERLTDFAALKGLEIAGISDDAHPVQGFSLAHRGFRKAVEEDLLLSLHSEDLSLRDPATGLATPEAEEIMIARNIALTSDTGARLHLCHLSTARGMAFLELAKAAGMAVTAEVTPHHLLLNEGNVVRQGAVAKVNPPLRPEKDRLALLDGVKRGLVDVIATDHAPHLWEEKRHEFTRAPAGIVGLETALSLVYTNMGLNMAALVRLMSLRPAQILSLNDRGHLGPGARADVVIFDAKKTWKIEGKDFLSKAKFTPFEGFEVRGEVVATVVGGEVVYESGGLAGRKKARDEGGQLVLLNAVAGSGKEAAG